jgi:hypothetical protein
VDVVGVAGGSLLVLIVEVSNPLHTLSRSSLYIYIAIEHLQQRLVAIRMLPHPDMCSVGPESGCCWCSSWVSVSTYS